MVQKVKVSMNIPVELKEYVEREAEKNGYNFTTQMQIMINEYKKSQEAIALTSNLKELADMCRRNGYNVNIDDMPC